MLDFDTLNFSIVLNTIVMTAGDVAAAQAEEPIIDTGGRDNSVKASTEKAFAVKPTFENATQEALIVQNSEALLVTSKMRPLLTQLTFARQAFQPQP